MYFGQIKYLNKWPWYNILEDRSDFYVLPIYDNGEQVNYYYERIGFVIPETCENPTKVMKFFNWIFEEKENFETMNMGIRGVDFDINNDGLYYALENGEEWIVNEKSLKSAFDWYGNSFFSHPEYKMYTVYDCIGLDKIDEYIKPASQMSMDIILGKHADDYLYFSGEEFNRYRHQTDYALSNIDGDKYEEVLEGYYVSEADFKLYLAEYLNFLDSFQFDKDMRFEPSCGEMLK